MPSKKDHPKVPPSQKNFDEDHQDKMQLNAEFDAFQKLVETEAKTSPDIKKLLVPLKKLEKAVIIGAHGKHFVLPYKKKKKR